MGGRQAQIKVNKCWGGMEISRHMPDCCNEVCAELSLCMLPVHYRHYHPGCLRSHQSNQPWSSVIKRINTLCCTQVHLAEQFTTIHSFMQRACRPQQIPLSVQPSCCRCESSGRRLAASLFWWISICGSKIIQSFWKQTLLLQRQRRWNGKCLRWNSTKTICGGDNVSDVSWCNLS